MSYGVRWPMLGGLAVALLTAGCGDPASPVAKPQEPPPLVIPPFVFVATVEGRAQLFRYRDDSVARLTDDGANDTAPMSAAGRIVFTSDRDGNAEIYLADPDLRIQRRVTKFAGIDDEPALDPRGETIAFVSTRTGIARVWLVAAPALTDTTFGVPAPLATGAPSYVPEGSPAWSPDGRLIAFTSMRTGTSQVFVVSALGGTATQVTHEAGGAFHPTWSADGSAIIFDTGTGSTSLRRTVLATGETTDLAAAPSGVAEASCNANLCLAVTDPYGDGGEIVALSTPDRLPQVVLQRTRHERSPAILVP